MKHGLQLVLVGQEPSREFLDGERPELPVGLGPVRARSGSLHGLTWPLSRLRLRRRGARHGCDRRGKS